ncbi:FAST kinase domain-containing protein 3, mitochondrial-like [Amphiura filiformis]|uniref:FAST kinase domain-containing protein 3, mitochondrial-like n=1 Tax=Amphiura filiformis TaxID=82378 RepID=UPI003B21700F
MLQIYNCIRPWRTCIISHQVMRRVCESSSRQRMPASTLSTILTGDVGQYYDTKLTMSTTHKMNSPLSPSRRFWHHSSILNTQQPPWQMPRTTVPSPNQVKPQSEPVEEMVDEGSLILLEQICDADSVQAILGVYEEQEDKFTEVHSARALWCLGQVCGRDYQKVASDVDHLPAEIGTTELIKMEGFRHLCSKVLQDSPHMSDASFLSILDSVQRLNISDRSDLVRTLLEQCKHRLNTLPPNELSLLVVILNRIPGSNTLARLLLDGAALKVPDIINDITQLIMVARFLKVLGRRLSFDDQKKLVNRLLAILIAGNNLTVESVIQGLTAVVDMRGHTKTYCKLALEFLVDKLDEVFRRDLVSIMIALSKHRYYDEEFFQVVGDHIAQMITSSSGSYDAWNLNQLSHICRVYTMFNHLHPALLDAIAELIVQSNRPYTMLSLTNITQAFAKLAYLPPDVPQILDFVTNACNMAEMEKEPFWVCISIATSLMCCGRYPDQMVEFILRRLSQQVSLDDLAMLNNLRKMHQVMRVRGFTANLPEFQKIIYSIPADLGQRKLSPKVERVYKKARVMTKEALTSVAKDTSDVVEDIDAGLGYTIDFVLKQEEIKEAVVLQDSKCYAANVPQHALVWNKLMEEHLQANGYQVVWLQVEDIITLIDTEERAAFISNRVGCNGA